jgi:hypothetical protein
VSDPEIVLPGYKILVELIDLSGEREKLTLQIVPDAFADFSKGFLGEGTPLCRAIYGKAIGVEIEYAMGDIRAVKVISATPTEDVPDSSVAQKRAETLKKAVDQSDRTNAILFASSFNGKWGDYDPSGLLDEEEKENPPDSG